MCISSSTSDFHNFHSFRPKPAAFWRRPQKGNRRELDGPEGVVIIVYWRRKTRHFRTCILSTKGLKRILPSVDFRKCRYSAATYGDEDAGCRRGWVNIKARILDAAGAA